jgi:carboxypeptidase PM20D1
MRKIARYFLLGILLLLLAMFAKMLLTTSNQPKLTFLGKSAENPEALRRLSEAIQFQTVSYDDSSDGIFKLQELDKMHAWFAKNYPKIYTKASVIKIGKGSLLFTLTGSNTSLKPALFLAHLDVVPAETKTTGSWTFPPFSGTIKNDTLYGRGTLDDKSIACAMLEAMEKRIASNHQPTRTIMLAFGHDEETGGMNGAVEVANYLKKQQITAEFICDEGFGVMEGLVPGVSRPVAIIGLAEKGYMSVKLSIDIAGGHSSFPKKENATGILAQVLARVENYDMRESICEPQKEFFSSIAPEASFGYRFLFSNLWITTPLVKAALRRNNKTAATLRTTHAITILRAGDKDNTLPAHAEAVINFRIIPGETVGSVLEELKRNIADERIVLQVQPDTIAPSPVSPTSGFGWDCIRNSIHESFDGIVSTPALVLTGTDCKNYTAISPNIYRFVPLRFNNSNLSGIHGSDEKIAANNYYEAIRYYEVLFSKL